ncbi:MAG: Flp family type IVb pilin [Saccharofermentanales bacterium]|jgi:pilus assembly protein Flp/PilA
MKKTLKRAAAFLKSEKGQGMVEYGLIIALVAIAVIAAVILLGDNIKAIFTTTTDALSLASGV